MWCSDPKPRMTTNPRWRKVSTVDSRNLGLLHSFMVLKFGAKELDLTIKTNKISVLLLQNFLRIWSEQHRDWSIICIMLKISIRAAVFYCLQGNFAQKIDANTILKRQLEADENNHYSDTWKSFRQQDLHRLVISKRLYFVYFENKDFSSDISVDPRIYLWAS